MAQVEGVELAADLAAGRLSITGFHAPPALDLAAPDIPAQARGSGFLTQEARAVLALAGLDLVLALPGLPPPPRPMPGVIAGRELLYAHGLEIGERVQVTVAGAGPRPGQIVAEISDTVGTGVLQIDQHLVLLPLPLAQRVAGRPGAVDGYRLRLAAGADRDAVQEAVAAAAAAPVRTWQESRGSNAVRMIASNRNLVAVLLVAVQGICVLFIYAVFSTLVAEKRRELGILLCLGARRRDLVRTVLLMGLIAGLIGAGAGWLLGWGLLALVNPISDALGMPLFPMDIFYSAQAPISFDTAQAAAYAGVMVAVALVAAVLPALAARSIDPIAVVREGA
jgi:ABC-type lipoprotein release transport system permease subunit